VGKTRAAVLSQEKLTDGACTDVMGLPPSKAVGKFFVGFARSPARSRPDMKRIVRKSEMAGFALAGHCPDCYRMDL
jgi:hypothetical protein